MASQEIRCSVVVAVLAGATAIASAQSCAPAWNRSIGSPGVTSDGYIGPMFVFNDGQGERLYAGGSLTAIGGYLTPGIAKWNPANNRWSALGTGLYSANTNSFVAAINAFDFGSGPRLVAGGSFDRAGGLTGSNNLSQWDGIAWSPLPGGQPNGAIWAICPWHGKLYVAGGFTSIGGVAAAGIAVWSSTAGWQSLGSGGGGGFSPSFFAMTAFNDGTGEKLYASGRFTSIGGVAGMIARWTGTEWEPVGGGVAPSSPFSDIETMAAFDDGTGPALYVGGWDLLPFQSSLCSVAKWNGQRWFAAGQHLGGRTTSLVAFNDGSGSALHAGGTAQPGINYIARLTAGQWITLDGGVGPIPAASPFPSVFGLCTWNGSMYVAGDFDGAGPGYPASSGIVARTSCPPCRVDVNHDQAVDLFDYLDFVSSFAQQSAGADFNGDGVVDLFDYLDFVEEFSRGC